MPDTPRKITSTDQLEAEQRGLPIPYDTMPDTPCPECIIAEPQEDPFRRCEEHRVTPREVEAGSPTMPDTLSRRNLRCSAIWNGCKCDRYPHEGNGHVWRNTLDGDLVDPALYPSAAHIDALTATGNACGNFHAPILPLDGPCKVTRPHLHQFLEPHDA